MKENSNGYNNNRNNLEKSPRRGKRGSILSGMVENFGEMLERQTSGGSKNAAVKNYHTNGYSNDAHIFMHYKDNNDDSTLEPQERIAKLQKMLAAQRQENYGLLMTQSALLMRHRNLATTTSPAMMFPANAQQHELEIARLKRQVSTLQQETTRMAEEREDLVVQHMKILGDFEVRESKVMEDVDKAKSEIAQEKKEFKTREKKLKHHIATQQLSMDSLFADLEQAKSRVEWLEAKLGNHDPSGDPSVLVTEPVIESNQADLLKPKRAVSDEIKVDETDEQRRIRELEEENAELRSDYVRLQAEYKEERYLSRKAIEELTDITEDGEYSSNGEKSENDEEDPASPPEEEDNKDAATPDDASKPAARGVRFSRDDVKARPKRDRRRVRLKSANLDRLKELEKKQNEAPQKTQSMHVPFISSNKPQKSHTTLAHASAKEEGVALGGLFSPKTLNTWW